MKFLNNLGVEKTVQLDFKAQTQVVPSDNLSRKLYWDDFNRTLSLEMGNGVIQQIGKERLVDVRNATASPIPNGTLVMITGALGASGRLTIAPAISDGSVSSFDILGITTEDITSGSDGIVTTFGLINGINTTGSAVGETWTAGDTLYPHPTILGALTNVLPQAPHLKAIVGRVNFVDATTGNIFIRLQYGSYLGGGTPGTQTGTSGLTISGTGEGAAVQIAHADTSSATSIASDNSNGVVIQDMTLTLDGFGHATAASVNTVDLDNRYYTETEIDTTLTTYQLRSEKGAANGYASLDSNGLVPNTQLPSYVDDVLEYANLASFPETGETGKIYVALDTNKTYRWSGSTYVYITSGAVDSVGGYTGVVTAQNVFDTVKTLDGTGSGLDADLLDGQHGSYYATAANLTTHTNNVVKHNNYAVADGTNSYTVTLSPAPLSYTAGMVVSFKAANANTGAVTLSCNGLLEKPVKKNVSSELASGDIVEGQVITVIYDGENFQIVSGSGGSGSGGGLVYQTPSVGDIKITAALDDNHLWCDGQAVSRITYADLFEVIGTTYGSGDGVTTFNLPDFNDGGLFYKSAICFRNFREVLNSSAFNPFLDADSIATVKSYFGTTPPDGWLWTQGQALSRVSYAGLFAVIGETYGVGDGVTTFNLPTIGTNYIIKVSNLLNNKVAALPTALTLTTYSETTVALTQGSAGTSVLADFDASKYMSAELVLQITQGAKFEMTKLHVISNGTDTYLEEYGRLGIATSVTFSTAISGSLVQIKVTSTTNPAIIKGKITRILK